MLQHRFHEVVYCGLAKEDQVTIYLLCSLVWPCVYLAQLFRLIVCRTFGRHLINFETGYRYAFSLEGPHRATCFWFEEIFSLHTV